MRVRLRALVVIAFSLHGARATAQSGEPLSVQGSVLATSIYLDKNVLGVGAEAQVRANRLATGPRSVLSAGLGGQYTSHSSGGDNIKLKGVFLEPRYVFVLAGGKPVFPYVAARLALLRQSSNFATQSNGFAAGGGAGFVYNFSRSVKFDIGGAVVRQSFQDATFTTTGTLNGTTCRFKPFAGFALKAGFDFGFGSSRG